MGVYTEDYQVQHSGATAATINFDFPMTSINGINFADTSKGCAVLIEICLELRIGSGTVAEVHLIRTHWHEDVNVYVLGGTATEFAHASDGSLSTVTLSVQTNNTLRVSCVGSASNPNSFTCRVRFRGTRDT